MMQASATAAALRCEGLVKRYGKQLAVDGVSLEVAAGAAAGLVGANGAGKTTFIKCALDLCAADGGRVEIFGVNARQAAARARLAYLPERFSPPHYLLGREFLAMTLALSGGRYDAARAAALAAALELEPAALGRPVRQLSKGMTQKLGLAACFLQERDLYVLDEPMSGLDPAGRLAVKAVLARLRGAGKTLFFTSHVLSDVEELCETIAVLDRGALRFRGAPAALRARTGEDNLERAFLKCVRSDGDAPAIGA
ncbi:MAG TPA: ATP-binding cassette domain-containing protein [Burkholderiales bacterium]|nr:ATP-binding cassette domain-containing protein [Burkholderiales bacterium]